jgi:hypothetical protein
MSAQVGGISLEAYAERGDGFEVATMRDVDELNKALSAGEITGRDTDSLTTASGAPLKVESLEKTLKVITFTQKNIVFWKDTPVLPAYNTVEEFNRLISYGSDQGGFTLEGELPEENDSTYVRKSELVKYMGNTRIITHPMTLVNTAHGAVIEREINNGTIWILSKLERALFEGNADNIPQEVNGVYKQMMADFSTEIEHLDSDQVIDLRGERATEQVLEAASNTIIENYGFPTDLYWAPKAGSDFAKNFYPRERVMTPIGPDNKVGGRITSFVSQAGEIPFHPNVFQRPKPTKTSTTGATSVKAPPVPVSGATGAAPVAATVTNSKWASSDAGNYFYAVSAMNRFGESALTQLNPSSAVIAVVASGAADLNFTAGAGQYPTSAFRIYRSNKGAASIATATFYPLFDVSTAQLSAGYGGGSAGYVRDLDRYMPNTSQALMLQRDLEVYSFKQLAPLMKMDLALLGPAYRFMVLLYGTPTLYAPRKMVRLINIGSTAPSSTLAGWQS